MGKKESFVYIIAHKQDGSPVGPVKVGVGRDPQKRLRSLQTGNPMPLALFQTFRVPDQTSAYAFETAFHEVMDAYRLHGEWFDMTPEQATSAMAVNICTFLKIDGELSEWEAKALTGLCMMKESEGMFDAAD